MFSKFRLFFTTLVCGCIFCLNAQQIEQDSLSSQTTALEEVVVSDSKFPLKRSQSGKPIIKIGSEELSQFQGLGLSELLRQYAGIEIIGSQSYAGQNKTVSLRGGRNRQVLILIDGIRVADPSRIDTDFNLNFLSLDQIESIEIMKGASSTLYGSSAATGVIQIQTKKTESGFNAQLQSSFGSENDQNSSIHLNLFKNSLDLSYSGAKWSVKGYAFNHQSSGMSAVIGPELDPFQHFTTGGSISYDSQSNFDFQAGYDRSSITADYDNSFPLEDADFRLTNTMDRFYFNPNYDYKNGGLRMRLGFQKSLRDFQSDYPFSALGENFQLELNNRYILGAKYYTVVGLLYQNQKADYQEGQGLSQTDFFANVVALFTKQFRVNLGGRINHNSSYGTHFTYSFNPSYSIIQSEARSLKFFTALSSAFIAPSLYQLYDPYSGNEKLKPEENTSLEFGTAYQVLNWNFNTAYFYRKENPSLIYDLSTYRYENARQDATYRGFEIQIAGELLKKLTINFQTTYTTTKEGDLRYLPKFSSQSTLAYKINSKKQVNLRFQSIGKRFGLDNTTTLDPYSLIHLSFQSELRRIPLRFFFHATNMLNTDYIEIENYSTRGRNFIIGLNYHFP